MKKLLPLLLAAACILSSCSCLPPGKGWTKELSDGFCLFYQTANQQGSFQSNYILTVTLPARELPADVRNRLIQLPMSSEPSFNGMTSVYPDDITVHFLVTSDIHQIRDLLGPGLVESSSLEIPKDRQGYFLLYQEKDNRDRIDIETCEMRWKGISLKHKIYIPGHLDGGSSSFDDLFMSPRQPRREDYQSKSGISMHLLIYDNDTMLYFLHEGAAYCYALHSSDPGVVHEFADSIS